MRAPNVGLDRCDRPQVDPIENRYAVEHDAHDSSTTRGRRPTDRLVVDTVAAWADAQGPTGANAVRSALADRVAALVRW